MLKVLLRAISSYFYSLISHYPPPSTYVPDTLWYSVSRTNWAFRFPPIPAFVHFIPHSSNIHSSLTFLLEFYLSLKIHLESCLLQDVFSNPESSYPLLSVVLHSQIYTRCGLLLKQVSFFLLFNCKYLWYQVVYYFCGPSSPLLWSILKIF